MIDFEFFLKLLSYLILYICFSNLNKILLMIFFIFYIFIFFMFLLFLSLILNVLNFRLLVQFIFLKNTIV